MLASFGRFPAALLCAAALAAPAAAARAQGKLDAHYSATIAGIPIGAGDWQVDIGDTHYRAEASGVTVGLVRVFIGGHGSSTAHGVLRGGLPLSSIYQSKIVTRQKSDEVELTVDNGAVKQSKVEPPLETGPDRIPITEEHRKGVLDPMTASLMRTPGEGDPLSPQACERSLAVFDGRMRYDLQFAYKRMDRVKADKGYAGPVVVCAVYVSPIAGFIPSRSAVRYIARLRDIEVWLAPIAGTRVLVPFRAQGPTPIGRFVLEATQFVSTATPSRASNGAKAH